MSDKGLPHNYFKNFSNRIKQEINSLPDELKKESPLLYKMRHLNGYNTPVNYFTDLVSQTLQLHQTKGKTVLLRNWLPAIAAGLFLVLGSVFIFSTQNNVFETNSEELVFEDAFEYYTVNLDEIDMALLSDLDEGQDDIIISEIDDQEIEEYVDLILDDFTDLEIENIY